MSMASENEEFQWGLIRAFLALMRAHDYGAAAELEGVDDSTLRKRIRTLERHVGRPLYVRSGRGWSVAPDEDELVHAALAMEAAARNFTPTSGARKGVVHLSVLDVFAQRFTPAFSALLEKYPGLSLKITTEASFVKLEEEQVDIAIRMACPRRDSTSLRLRKIGDLSVNAYASHAYLASVCAGGVSADQVSHRLLAMDLSFPHADHSFTYSDLNWANFGIRGKDVITADSFTLLAELCEKDQGVAILPEPLPGESPHLTTVRPDWPGVTTELWLVSRLSLRADWQHDLYDLLHAEVARWSAPGG